MSKKAHFIDYLTFLFKLRIIVLKKKLLLKLFYLIKPKLL